jgi:hypothetical protein
VLPGTADPLQHDVLLSVSSMPPEGMQPLTGTVPQIWEQLAQVVPQSAGLEQ